jgi:Xaa-Pro aminopeptidase
MMNGAPYQKRWEKARNAMQEGDIDALFLVPTTDLSYLTGFRGHINDRLTGFLLTGERAFFLYPAFERESLNREILDSAECIPHRDGEDPYGILLDVLARPRPGPAPARAIAVDSRIWGGTLLTLQVRLPKTRWLDAGKILRPLRLQKDAAEYEALKKAQLLAGAGLRALYNGGLAGRTEREAAARLTGYCAEAGLAPADWGPIVASGPLGANPHHESGGRVIGKGDPVLIDFGGVYNGYQADMTRTAVVGKAGEEFRAVYETVRAANEAAFRAARPGLPCEKVDEAARAVISGAGYGEYFTHRLGHGLGLDIHEDPYMVAGNAQPLLSGMAFSDEPGIYLPGKFGVRIEDILFMGEAGAERLTEFPREIVEL